MEVPKCARITALLLMLLLLPGLVAAEDDFDLDDILSDADPDVVKNTYSQPGNADDILLDENNEPVSIYEEDGSILITLTATGTSPSAETAESPPASG